MPGVSGLHQMLNLIKYISKQFDAYGEHPRYIHVNINKNPPRHHDEVEKCVN